MKGSNSVFRLSISFAFFLIFPLRGILFAQEALVYQKPPVEILKLVDIQSPPTPMMDKNVKYIAFLERPTFKTLEEIGENELRLGGIRINTQTFDASRSVYFTGLKIQFAESGKELTLKGLPSELKIEYPSFSPGYNYLSFANSTQSGLELWIIDLKNGNSRKLASARLSGVTGRPYIWSGDEKFIYCFIRATSKPNFAEKELPKGPAVQESMGTKAPVRTYQDLLKNSNDEARFEFYSVKSVSKIYLDGKEVKFMPEKIYKNFEPSPDGNYILTEEVNKPFSYQVPYYQFPYSVNIYDKNGKLVKNMENKPLQDVIPISFDAVESGRRDFSWRGDKPATIVWCEAQDGGDPSVTVDKRDKVYQLDFPFSGKSSPLCATLNRFSGIIWGDDKTAIVYDRWRKNRNRKAYLINPSAENSDPKIIQDGSTEDLYGDPGRFVTAPNEYNESTLLFGTEKNKLYLIGEGYSPEGNKPFIDEYNISTDNTKRLWRADGLSTYESIVSIIDIKKNILLTRIEGPAVYPNYYIRNFSSEDRPKQVTFIENPYKSFENVSKQKIFYKRSDGVDLSATLYLPAGYDKTKGRLPMLMEAYPTEYKDPKAAGQLRESPFRFVSLYWSSPVFWAARGFAVMQGAQFPIIGRGNEEPNDTYIEQLVENAKAAIHAVDTMGVVDPQKVAVMGHSYGAFMTANLLAHSDLFAAGIARSGAYNRTLTPFGFQAEERTYWQAKDVYDRMSPFNYADKIKAPLLMIHGEADNNSGTFPIQSERMFQAIKGLGGTARLVFLPFESHSYAARENILHMLWEMDSWLDKYVANKK